jgi:hypothetical protein
MKARPISEYHEDMGAVLWWKFPIEEPPYVGTPGDFGPSIAVKLFTNMEETPLIQCGSLGGWTGYHTHFTMIEVPDEPA